MYYPFLRAKRFELSLLKELVTDGVMDDVTVPVLEPINGVDNSLKSANEFFTKNDFHPYLIINPKFKKLNDGVITDFLEHYWANQIGCFNPAFIYNDNEKYIYNLIGKYDLTNVMLILLDNFTDNKELRDLCLNSSVSHIMLLNSENNINLSRFIRETGKISIRLDDMFQKMNANAEYLPIQAKKFTEHHKYFGEQGFDGFSDFTVLPKLWVDGGQSPYAIVIHLTYIGVNNEIWIRHFTSETNHSSENPQGKFAEAARKATSFCEKNNINNSAIKILNEYYSKNLYPGLGMIKKISIKNHLIVVSDYLRV
jgi:hypothetical protein